MKINNAKLTPRQNNFVNEYLIDLNATQAYIRAGYSGKGAGVSANNLLSNPKIKSVLKVALNKREEKTEITSAQVLTDLREIADVCLGRKASTTTKTWVDDDGQPQCEEMTITRFNPGAGIKALETIGKHLGMFAGDDQTEDINAIFIAGIRSFITSTKKLPRDQ